MKKIIKYILGISYFISLGLFFVPIIEISIFKISMFDIIKFGFGMNTTINFFDSINEALQNYFFPFSIAVIGLITIIIVVAVLSIVLKEKLLGFFSICSSIVINVYLFVLVFLLLSTGNDVGDSLIGNFIEINYIVIILWVIIYVFIMGMSIFQLLSQQQYQSLQSKPITKTVVQSKDDNINNEKIRNNQVPKRIDNNYFGVIIGTGIVFSNMAYTLDEKREVFFENKDESIEMSEVETDKTLVSIYYIPEYEEYCIKAYQLLTIYLKSGQPLGKDRIYYLPRGTEIYILDKKYSFKLA